MRTKWIVSFIPMIFLSAGCEQPTGRTDPGNGSGSAGHPWPTYQGNFRRTGQSPFVGAREGVVEWHVEDTSLHRILLSSPAIAEDGTIYVCTQGGKIIAYEPNGSKKWELLTANPLSCSPTVLLDGNVLYTTVEGEVLMVTTSGTVNWSYQLNGESGFTSPAVDVDRNIYIVSQDTLVSLTFAGTLRWKFPLEYWSLGSAALADDSTLYVVGKDLYCLRSDGTLRWSYPLPENQSGAGSTPALGPDGRIYLVDFNGNLHAVSPAGEKLWEFKSGYGGVDVTAPALSADGIVYMCRIRYLAAISAVDGNLLWSKTWPWPTDIQGAPVVGADGTVYVGGRGSTNPGLANFLAFSSQGEEVLALELRSLDGGAITVFAPPAFPGDGSVILATEYGGVFKVR